MVICLITSNRNIANQQKIFLFENIICITDTHKAYKFILAAPKREKDNNIMSTENNSTDQHNLSLLFDTASKNLIRMVDAMAPGNEFSPPLFGGAQLWQAVSNFHLDYLQGIKDRLQKETSFYKYLAGAFGLNSTLTALPKPFLEQLIKQSHEITSIALNIQNLINQLIINAIESARVQIKLFDGSLSSLQSFLH